MGMGSARIATRSKKLGPPSSEGISGRSARGAVSGSDRRDGSRGGAGWGRSSAAGVTGGAGAGSAAAEVDFSLRNRYSSRSSPSGENILLSVTLISFFSFDTSDPRFFPAAKNSLKNRSKPHHA